MLCGENESKPLAARWPRWLSQARASAGREGVGVAEEMGCRRVCICAEGLAEGLCGR